MSDVVVIDRKYTGKAGAYIVRHVQSNCIYIGSTGCLYARRSNHESQLKRQVHPNIDLQGLFNQDPRLEYTVFLAENRHVAYDLEQELLDHHFKTEPERVLNIGRDVRSTNKGRIFGPEHREKLRQYRLANPVSEATKEKIRLANTGKKRSPEFSALMKIINKGRPRTPEWNKKNSLAQATTSVRIDGVEYRSLTDAGRAHGMNSASVLYRVKHPRFPNWEYKD